MHKYFNPELPQPLSKILNQLPFPAKCMGNDSMMVERFASLKSAKPGALSFITGEKYLAELAATNASAVFISEKLHEMAPKNDVNYIVVDNPQAAFVTAVNNAYPDTDYFNLIGDGINADMLPANVSNQAKIGDNCIICPGAFIGRGVSIGNNCYIGPNVVITHAKLGDNCIVERNTSIGQDGFGCYRHKDIVIKIKQIGDVIIGNNVEIGANCAIDRGTIDSTIINDYCKLDNQIQIAHNVVLGQSAIIAAKAAIAGSTKVGKRVTIAGQSGITGHITIADDVTVTARAGVTKSVAAKKIVAGFPATDITNWKKECITLKKISKQKR